MDVSTESMSGMRIENPPGIVGTSMLGTSNPNTTLPTTESPLRVPGSIAPLNMAQPPSQQPVGSIGPLTQNSSSQVVVTSTGSQTPQTSVTTTSATANAVNGIVSRSLLQQTSTQQPQPAPHASSSSLLSRDSLSTGNQHQTPIVTIAPNADMSSSATSQSQSQTDGAGSDSNSAPDVSLTQEESRAKQQSARRCAINFLKIYYRTLSANSKDLLRYYDLNACLDRISCGEFQNDESTGMSLQSLRHLLRNFGSVLRVTIKLIDYQYSRDDNVLISVHGAMQFDRPINPMDMDEMSGSKRERGSQQVPPGTDVAFLQVFYLTRNTKGWWVIQNDIFRFMNDGHLRIALQPSFVPVAQPMDTMLGLGGHGDGPRSSPLQNALHQHGFSPNMHPLGGSRSMGPTLTTNSTQTSSSQTVLGSEFSSNESAFRRSNPTIHGQPVSGANGESERSRRRMPRVTAGGMTMEARRGRPPMNEMSGHSVSTPHSGSGTPSGRSGRRGSSGSVQFSFSNGVGAQSVAGHRSNQQRPSSSHGPPFQRQNNGQYDNVSSRPRQYFGGERRGNARHGPRAPEYGIFVKLEIAVSSEELREACQDFGTVENVQMYTEKKFAFVFFKSHDGMMHAVNSGKIILRGIEHPIQKKRPQKDRTEHFPSRGDSTHGSGGPASRRGHRAARGSGHDQSSRPASKSRSSRQGEKSGREGDGSRTTRDRDRDRMDNRPKQTKPTPRGASGASHTSSSSTSGSSPKKSGKKNKSKQSSQFQSRDREKTGGSKSQASDPVRVIFSGDGVDHGQKENVDSENFTNHSKQLAERELDSQV